MSLDSSHVHEHLYVHGTHHPHCNVKCREDGHYLADHDMQHIHDSALSEGCQLCVERSQS